MRLGEADVSRVSLFRANGGLHPIVKSILPALELAGSLRHQARAGGTGRAQPAKGSTSPLRGPATLGDRFPAASPTPLNRPVTTLVPASATSLAPRHSAWARPHLSRIP